MKQTLHIGDVEVGLPAVQAALSGYSDLAMRAVAREHGATYAINEVVLDSLVLQKGKLRRILSVPEYDHPVGGQLMGSQPETFGDAARALVKAGYDVVDINFGCPVNKVLGGRGRLAAAGHRHRAADHRLGGAVGAGRRAGVGQDASRHRRLPRS